MPAKLEPGADAPDFNLPSTEGNDVSLKGLRGKKVVLYFYPQDDTPGCTTESCDFRDRTDAFRAAGAAIYGVSPDDLDSHAKFRAKFTLPFPLLVDADNAVATAYGAYGEKTLYGKKVTGTIRTTYILDEAGKVLAGWSPVKVADHAEKVLAVLKGEGKPPRKPASTSSSKP